MHYVSVFSDKVDSAMWSLSDSPLSLELFLKALPLELHDNGKDGWGITNLASREFSEYFENLHLSNQAEKAFMQVIIDRHCHENTTTPLLLLQKLKHVLFDETVNGKYFLSLISQKQCETQQIEREHSNEYCMLVDAALLYNLANNAGSSKSLQFATCKMLITWLTRAATYTFIYNSKAIAVSEIIAFSEFIAAKFNPTSSTSIAFSKLTKAINAIRHFE